MANYKPDCKVWAVRIANGVDCYTFRKLEHNGNQRTALNGILVPGEFTNFTPSGLVVSRRAKGDGSIQPTQVAVSFGSALNDSEGADRFFVIGTTFA